MDNILGQRVGKEDRERYGRSTGVLGRRSVTSNWLSQGGMKQQKTSSPSSWEPLAVATGPSGTIALASLFSS